MDTTSQSTKPGRPLGLSLAIIISVLLFTVAPLVQVFFLLEMNRIIQISPGEGMSGINVTGIPDASLYAQTVLGLLFFLIAIFAWRGRPPSVRFVLLGAVLALTAVTIVMGIIPVLNPTCDLQSGCDSGGDLSRSVGLARLCFTLLIPLYVIWYTNRAPARAFFRGYYLSPPPAQVPESAGVQTPSG